MRLIPLRITRKVAVRDPVEQHLVMIMDIHITPHHHHKPMLRRLVPELIKHLAPKPGTIRLVIPSIDTDKHPTRRSFRSRRFKHTLARPRPRDCLLARRLTRDW